MGFPCLNHGQSRTSHRTRRHNDPPALADGRILKSFAQVPRQMPQSIQAVEHEWECQAKLCDDFRPDWPRCNRCDERWRLDVPAQWRANQVCETVEIEPARENAARDTVEGGAVHGDVGLEDGKVGGDGASEALFGENGVGGGAGASCGESEGWLAFGAYAVAKGGRAVAGPGARKCC